MLTKLNTMETLDSGFKIERNGEVITLTREEMADFRYLNTAIDGRSTLECYDPDSFEIDEDKFTEMKNNVDVCNAIENFILDILFEDCGEVEAYVIQKYIDEIMGEEDK